MIFRDINKLTKEAGSRYGLVIAVTKRARDLNDMRRKKKEEGIPLDESDNEKVVSVAIDEFTDEKVVITNDSKCEDTSEETYDDEIE